MTLQSTDIILSLLKHLLMTFACVYYNFTSGESTWRALGTFSWGPTEWSSVKLVLWHGAMVYSGTEKPPEELAAKLSPAG